MFNRCSVIVFSRLPVRGAVKRRLAREIGEKEAFSCFKRLYIDSLQEVLKVNASRFLFLTPYPEDFSTFTGSWPLVNNFSVKAQVGDDLGQRMKNALLEIFKMGFEIGVIVGTDVPDLRAYHIEQAFKRLLYQDIVLGPCEDGGYYLIGVRSGLRDWQELFHEIPWGTSEVFERTIYKAQKMGYKIHVLEMLYDVDHYEDVMRWRQSE
ncbi:Glycosyltransferase [Dissulfuribacter thermophilus]|uniref:Glycosyltransferase n=1 Tax=Dissulfuribacter thermophilus TaxID=1156395 RepID=A0A1B9F448_9BACT|nr:Glycosyltransferase [Dissulfuribacter thermophilus]